MLLFRYFEPIKDETSNVCKQAKASSIVSKHASSGALGLSEKDASEGRSEVGKTSRTQYAEKDNMRISR